MVLSKAKALKKRFDAKEYGDAPFLGIAKPVIKAHGNSDAKAIKNAIRQAIAYVKTDVIAEIEALAAEATAQ
jgi:glycerol-3-phosphate acyltransferase PlsX